MENRHADVRMQKVKQGSVIGLKICMTLTTNQCKSEINIAIWSVAAL